jgi:hypothetical protein
MSSHIRRAVQIALLLAVPAIARSEAMGKILTSVKSVELGARPVTITLTSRTLGAAASTRHLELVLRGLRSDNPPDVLVNVYVGLAAGERPAEGDPRYVGSLNFYAANPFNPTDRVFQIYDLTAALRSLRRRHVLGDSLRVTFVPEGTPAAGTKASLARVELVAR